MPLSNLSPQEQNVVRRCLTAAAEGPFFEDWEFGTLFGCDRADVRGILTRWPDVDDTEPLVDLAINNAMVNLLGYPHGHEEAFATFIGHARNEVARIYDKWRGDGPAGVQ